MKNMRVIWILVAALAVLPCHAADKPDATKAAKTGEGRADVAKEVLAMTGSHTKIVADPENWARS